MLVQENAVEFSNKTPAGKLLNSVGIHVLLWVKRVYSLPNAIFYNEIESEKIVFLACLIFLVLQQFSD